MTSLDQIVEFNRQQKNSETDTFTERRYRQFARRIAPSAKKVLDVGCNTGRGGAVLKSLRPDLELVGLDCVPERVTALDPLVYASSVCSFSQSIELPSANVDAIVAGEFIEHVPPDLVAPTLFEFFRVLKLRGRLLLTTPNPGYLKNLVKDESVLSAPSHVSQHHPKSLARRLEDVGFSRIRIRGSGRVSSVLGEFFPVFSVYGSYLVDATKW